MLILAVVIGRCAESLFGYSLETAVTSATKASAEAIRRRIRAGRVELPANHNLENAHRDCLREASRLLLGTIVAGFDDAPAGRLARWWATVRGTPMTARLRVGGDRPRAAWCRAFEERIADVAALDRLDARVTLEQEALESIASAEFDDKVLDAFHRGYLAWIQQLSLPGTPPARLTELVLEGWAVADPDEPGTGAEPMSVYKAYCLWFQDAIKRGGPVAEAVEMNSRRTIAKAHQELLARLDRLDRADDGGVRAEPLDLPAVSVDDLVDAVRVEVGPAMGLLADKLDAIEVGHRDIRRDLALVTTELAAQTTALARIEHNTEQILDQLDVLLAAVVPEDEDVDALERSYLEWVAERHAGVEMSLPSAEDASPVRLPIESLWVGDIPLTLQNSAGGESAPEARSFTDKKMRRSSDEAAKELRAAAVTVDAALADTTSRMIVLGGPGSGKSTILRRLAHRHATGLLGAEGGDGSLVPILVRCGDQRGRAAASDLRGLVEFQLRAHGRLSDHQIAMLGPVMVERLEQGRAILLVDGLDEITSAERRAAFVGHLRDLARAHPSMAMVVTARQVGSGTAVSVLGDELDTYSISELAATHRAAFVQAWARAKGVPDRDLDETYGELVRALRGRGEVARLADSVLMLSLIVQTHELERRAGSRSLPGRRRDLYRRIVELRVENQREGVRPKLTFDELVPRLEFLALAMRASGDREWPEAEVCRVLRRFDASIDADEFPTVAPRRAAHEWVADAVALEALVPAGPGPTRRGIPQGTVGFFHHEFQAHFAGCAMRNRWIQPTDGSRLLDELLGLLRAPSEGESPTRFEVAGFEITPDDQWFEVARHCVEAIDAETLDARWFEQPLDLSVDDVLLALLAHPDGEAPTGGIDRATFALLCLSGVSGCTTATAHAVLDAALSTTGSADFLVPAVTDGDGTSPDQALRATLESIWGTLVTERYLRDRGEPARQFGSRLMTALSPMDVAPEQLTWAIRLRLARIGPGASAAEQVLALLEITELLYEAHGAATKAVRDDRGRLPPCGLPDLAPDVAAAAWDALLTIVETEGPTAPTAAWTLSWLSMARSVTGDGSGLTPSRRDRIRRLVAGSVGAAVPMEPFCRADLALLLALPDDEPRPFATFDWIYEWAVVADGGHPQRDLPTDDGPLPGADTALLESVLASGMQGRPAWMVALAAGRLGLRAPMMVEPLLDLFTDPGNAPDDRDEALYYLVRIGGPVVHEALVALASRYDGGTEDPMSVVYERSLLAIVGSGDVALVESLLGDAPHPPGYDFAYLRALAGTADPTGILVLQRLAHGHPDERVQGDARKALLLADQWRADGTL